VGLQARRYRNTALYRRHLRCRSRTAGTSLYLQVTQGYQASGIRYGSRSFDLQLEQLDVHVCADQANIFTDLLGCAGLNAAEGSPRTGTTILRLRCQRALHHFIGARFFTSGSFWAWYRLRHSSPLAWVSRRKTQTWQAVSDQDMSQEITNFGPIISTGNSSPQSEDTERRRDHTILI